MPGSFRLTRSIVWLPSLGLRCLPDLAPVGQSFERGERGAEAPLGARTAREQPACPVLPLRRRLMLKKLIVSTLVTGALSLGAAVAAAQPTVQRGLVNINVGDV